MRMADRVESVRAFLCCFVRVLCPSERKTVQIHCLLSIVAWLRLRRPLAGERLGATAAIWHYDLLGHTRLTKLVYIVA